MLVVSPIVKIALLNDDASKGEYVAAALVSRVDPYGLIVKIKTDAQYSNEAVDWELACWRSTRKSSFVGKYLPQNGTSAYWSVIAILSGSATYGFIIKQSNN